MKITNIRATPVRVPWTKPFTSSLGHTVYTENAVVEIETDEGVSGIGEASSIWDRKGLGESEDINKLLADVLTGRDPFQIRAIQGVMDDLLRRSFPAKAGIEMALYDILGKVLNTPVYNLLGGMVRDRVLLSRSLSMGEPDAVAQEAAGFAGEGYKTLKVKVGMDQDRDRKTVEAVRRTVGEDVRLRVDANMGWRNAKEAIRQIRVLAEFHLELVEQPLHFSDLKGLRFVRDHVEMPIMVDESVWIPGDALACIQAGAADVFNVYVGEAGGLGPAARIFDIAEAARLPCIIGSMPELGIGTAAQAHLAFAMRNLGYASDVNGCTYQADDVINEELSMEDGYLYPPSGPGLGVTLNAEKVEKYRI